MSQTELILDMYLHIYLYDWTLAYVVNIHQEYNHKIVLVIIFVCTLNTGEATLTNGIISMRVPWVVPGPHAFKYWAHSHWRYCYNTAAF